MRGQGLSLERTPWYCNMPRYPKFHANLLPLGLTSYLTRSHTTCTPAMLLFLTYMQLVPTSGPLSVLLPPLGHTAPVPPMASSFPTCQSQP